MYCSNCGREIPAGARFCSGCGTAVRVQEAAPSPKPHDSDPYPKKNAEPTPHDSSRPRKVSERKRERQEEPKKDSLILRLIFLLCALIALCWTAGSVAVDVTGKSAYASITSKHIKRNQTDNSSAKRYTWEINYEFLADDGEIYSGYRNLKSKSDYAPPGLSKYHVNYLPAMPRINRLVTYDPLPECENALEFIMEGGYTTILTLVLGFLLSYFLFFLTFPKITFFGIGKK